MLPARAANAFGEVKCFGDRESTHLIAIAASVNGDIDIDSIIS